MGFIVQASYSVSGYQSTQLVYRSTLELHKTKTGNTVKHMFFFVIIVEARVGKVNPSLE